MALRKYIPLLFGFVLLILLLDSAVTYRNLQRWSGDNKWVIHTQQVIIRMGEVRSLFRFVLNRFQTYLLTGEEKYIRDFNNFRDQRWANLNSIRTMTMDNLGQQKRLDEIQSLADDQNLIYAKAFQLLKKGKLNPSQKAAYSSELNRLGDRVRDVGIEFINEENGLLAVRTAESDVALRQTLWIFASSMGFTLLLVVAVLILAQRGLSFGVKLKEAEFRLSTIIKNVPLIFCSIDSKGTINLSTGKGLEAVGLPAGGSQGKSIFEVYRNNPSVLDKVKKALGGEEAQGLIDVNGFPMEALYKPIKGAQGRVTEVVGVAIDVTARRKVEEALKTSEASYREIFDKANDAIYIHDASTGRVLDVNQRTCDIFGFTREEFLNGSPDLFMTGNPGFTTQDAMGWLQKAATEGPQLFEWQGKNKDGSFRWLEVSINKAVIAGEERLLAFVRDVGDRKKLEEVTRNQDFIKSVLENLPNMVFVKEAKELRFVMFNKAGEELLGYSQADLQGKNDYDFFPKEEAEFFVSKDRKVLEEGKLLDIPEETLQTREKGPRILHTKKIPIFDEAGIPRFLLGISEDITDRKRQEEMEMYTTALEVSNREMQEFVFVASHDLQEPLRKIQSFGQFLVDEFKETLGETGKDYVGRMQSAASRMQILINDLLALTRVTTKAQPFVSINLSQVVKEVLVDLETIMTEKKAKVSVETLPTLEADATQMRQLFQNLIANAIKFQKPGVPPEIKVSAVVEGDQCRILVKDNGIGFDNKYGNQIFKVFERLHGRDEYEGTGIGLAICRKVVERHNGTIRAEGFPGKGSTFTITLPFQQKR